MCLVEFAGATPRCPSCEERLTVTADRKALTMSLCELALEDARSRSQEAPSDNSAEAEERWDPVYQAASPADASFLVDCLEGQDIAARIGDPSNAWGSWWQQGDVLAVTVPATAADKAREVVAEVMDDDSDPGDEFSGGSSAVKNPDRELAQLLAAAHRLHTMGDRDHALRFVRQAQELAPDSATPVAVEADLHYDARDYPAARACAERALAMVPLHAQALWTLLWVSASGPDGIYLARGADLDTARDTATKILKIQPRAVRALEVLADTARHAGDTAAARAHLQAALTVNPLFEPAQRTLAELG
jgi:tetratricopeptide (TPR) repeat protein